MVSLDLILNWWNVITWNSFGVDDFVIKSLWASNIKARPLDFPDCGIGSNLVGEGLIYSFFSFIKSNHDTIHMGRVESLILFSLSWSVSQSICSWYLLFLNISLAFCLLNVQHIPRSVGYIEKMLEQFILLPFHTHPLIIPKKKFQDIGNIK